MKISQLREHELLRDGVSREEIESFLTPEDESGAPWIVKLLLGVGGWLTAIFVAGFTGVVLFETFRSEEQTVAVGVGLVYLAGSVLLSRKSNHPFLNQLTLAIGTAGLALVAIGLWGAKGNRDGLYSLCGMIVLCPVVYLFSKNVIQRFCSVFAIFIVWLIYQTDHRIGLDFSIPQMVALLLTLAMVCGILKTSFWRPALFGSVFGSFLLLFVSLLQQRAMREDGFVLDPVWLAGLIAVGFPAVVWWLIKPDTSRSLILLIVLGVALFAMTYFGAGGIAVCLGLLLVSHARNDRALGWIAIAGLAVFVVAFYYFLGVPLLTKSYMMMGSGVLFLLVPFLAKFLSNPDTHPSL